MKPLRVGIAVYCSKPAVSGDEITSEQVYTAEADNLIQMRNCYITNE